MERVWRKGNTVSGDVNWCSHHGKQCTNSSAIKNKTAIWYSNYIFGWGSSIRQRIIINKKKIFHINRLFFFLNPKMNPCILHTNQMILICNQLLWKNIDQKLNLKKYIAWKQNVSRSQEKLWITGLSCCVPEINGRRVEKSSVNSLGEHISM